tara:strand:+ start:33 stop:473 length:441 start_codon:yes stop_codon:yes gene_type:complete
VVARNPPIPLKECVGVQKEKTVTFNVLELLEEEGYIKEGEDNVVHAEKAFFAARVMKWIRDKVQTEPDFDLTTYLTMLMYYKTGMADLTFSENEDKILYHLREPDKDVQELIDSLIQSTRKTVSEETSNAAREIAEPTNSEDPADS